LMHARMDARSAPVATGSKVPMHTTFATHLVSHSLSCPSLPRPRALPKHELDDLDEDVVVLVG
jgi:hypothetical protein